MVQKTGNSFTLVELLVLILVVSTLALVFVARQRQNYRERRLMSCKGNLIQLGMAMVQYIDQFGKGRYYTWPGPQQPTFNGAQWIASVYWVSLMPEPDIFICSGSDDDNDYGVRLGRKFTSIAPRDVSYAGRNGMRGAIVDKMPTSTVMMSDDSEWPDNHEESVNVLYFDAHVETIRALSPSDIGVNKPVDMLRN